jgi:DNA-binding LacI/PurR family transcriptional regulator
MEVGVSPTIADVARRAGVGVGTVSRVLNDRPKVGADTRTRVLAAIAELDYVPSANARRLSSGRTQTVAVVTTHLVAPSVVERVRGIEQSLTRAGLDLMIRNVETKQRRDDVVREIVRTDRIDGAILISISPDRAELAQIQRSRLPVVLVDAHSRSLPRIVCDDLEGGRIAATHLVDLGHTRVAFIGDPPRPSLGVRSSSMRRDGVEAVLAARGLQLRTGHILEVQLSRREARELAMSMLGGPDRPTAVMAANDTLAFGVLEAARTLGLAVPDDLSVIGYDDIETADLLGLTTIHQPLYETGVLAVNRLLEAVAGEARGPLRTVLPVHLVQRRTTGAAPV